ncbi:alkaline phosphatase family protein [Lapillicoccus jejuensis]|uniref:Phosphoesterase family protein n=1 Tax=Lapillicoccus jejuensis TaxID=402171 RepID=A0A542DZH3_9MICO|nr:alkaline phosphatase family protein [Lapillicoccus jejuensis]TQJ08491.1 phosphoesterase family protein [Lapillicoccus jejuensis]
MSRRSSLSAPRRLAAASAAVALGVGALLAGGGAVASASAPARATTATPPLPKIGHVWTIIFENKSFESTFTGLNQNDYLWKTLPSYGELLRQYYGTGHYSLDNYISLVSGQAPAPANQADCPQYVNVAPGFPAPDGQTYASTGCVYPKQVKTLFNQLDQVGKTWKVYAQDMGNDPTRENPYQCGIPGIPDGAGVPDPGGATPTDQYVPKHNPAAWFHSMIDSPRDCKRVVPLDGYAATTGHAAIPSIADDLKSVDTTPAMSWITPNNCSDAHDATCKGDNLSGDPNNHQGGLYAADRFLEKYIPMIMQSPAFQKDGMIQVLFDEAFPPYKMYGNSIADAAYAGDAGLGTDSATGNPVQAEANTAQSVIACCNELPGPNTTQPGFQAFNQDTTPGGGITGAVFISRFITPGSVSDQPYNHYSWLRSMEDLFGVTSGGADGAGHLGYAGQDGLRTFGADVYTNRSGRALQPAPMGSSVYPATATAAEAPSPKVVHAAVPVGSH